MTLRVNRRSLLFGSAALAGAAGLGACSSGSGTTSHSGSGPGAAVAVGSAEKPLPRPAKFQEAPALKGKGLPPVEQRLPENPYVIPHRWVKPGKYGGKLNLNTVTTQGAAVADSDREFFYGHSPLRYLNDGKSIGPGIVESWETNDDSSEWTFHFRKWLKWSDGEPWTTASVLWWWDNFILAQKMAQTPPDDARSGKGTLAKFTAVDDTTLKLTFDTPAPLTADRMAAWVNGNTGRNGPIWTMPHHYLKQFHPSGGKDVGKDWDADGGLMATKADWHRNPDCPTLTGFKCRSFDNNKGVVLERNPYYYAVMPNGDQLPYVDEMQFTVITDPEVGKLQVEQGAVDYTQGSFNGLILSDVEGLRKSTKTAGTELVLWDSGSGTGSIFFLNYDYIEDDLRELFREPKFRQAISYAFNRDAVQKSVYYNTGEKTTGTLSAKAVDFQVNQTGKDIYKQWRDAYVRHDPEKARQLLDELGLKDQDGDGIRELPNGKKLALRLEYSADESAEHSAKDNQLVADLAKVGLKMTRTPIPPQSFDDQWMSGKLMAHTNWEVGDGHPLIYPGWIVPTQYAHWAPLEGQWWQQQGTKTNSTELNVDPWKRHPPRMEPDKGGPVAKLWDLFNQAKVEPDEMKRHELVWEIFKIHISDGPFFMGCVANYPQVMVIKSDLMNVPRRENLALGGFVNPWIHPTPAVYDPECYYWQDPSKHT
ncbi:peptide ABC transporter substrate-binding protein [Microlunatus endophyticus]|uniref:Peptide ABC transporter substrate-binding protein n=1 Tax=Microlunatus endophyticus TaxID=1716077 RepID=A0A917SAG2_9ACTN|nr:ABC transporter substrate-binding protein [Microlunatus endophyticus]GGL63392.1 peptide ABC transporter substrate-binding protein [Microlunatus endophyticus]